MPASMYACMSKLHACMHAFISHPLVAFGSVIQRIHQLITMSAKRHADSDAPSPPTKKGAPTPLTNESAPPLAASQGSTSQIVPMGKLKLPTDGATAEVPIPAPLCPTISRDADEQGVLANMRGIIPYVKFHLKEALRTTEALSRQFPDIALHMHQPLKIKDIEGLKAEELRSFKHPWDSARAQASLEGASMYEAAGNILWCDPMPPLSGHAGIIAGDVPTWQEIEDLAAADFDMASAYTQAGAAKSTVSRLIFRSVVTLVVDDVADAAASHFNSSMKILSEHAQVWAWYYALFQALQAKNVQWTSALWQAGLCVTLQIRHGLTLEDQAVWSMQLSDKRKQDARLSDSFVAFALKALVILQHSPAAPRGTDKTIKYLNQKGIRFNGTNLNRAMLTAVQAFEEKISAEGLACLHRIERRHGKDVLSNSYTKLSRVTGQGAALAEKLGQTAAPCIQWLLECLEWQLKYEMIAPANLTVDVLNPSKSGEVGMIHVAMGRFAIHRSIVAWAEDLASEGTEAQALARPFHEVAHMFSTYPVYEREFDKAQMTEEDGDDVIAPAKRRYPNRVCHMLIDLLYDLMSGVHDAAIRTVLKASADIKECNWLEGLVALRDIYRLLSQHRHVAEATDGMPAAGPRTLARQKSEAADDPEQDKELRKERAEAWRLAQLARKRLTYVGHAKASTKADVQQFYEKTPAFSHTGRPGEQHRVIIFSADLFQESRTSPWSTPPEWNGTADVLIDWLVSQTGNCDVLFASDGRSRACRLKIETAFEKARNLHEAWIVFKPMSRWGRKVAFAADNKESINISMPLGRTQLAARPRADLNSAGEMTTHETTYTGVTAVPWGALPLLSPANKEKVLGYAPALPPPSASKEGFDASFGAPLFWQERKSAAVWKRLLLDLQATAVFDLTPGSGQCAKAAMEAGINYSCMARNAEHCSWLVNVLDRVGLAMICKTGSPLHHHDLSTCTKEHFADTLDQLNEQDQAPETIIEDEN